MQPSNQSTHWGYTGKEGSQYWGSLSPEYSTCSSGANQSPVNLSNFVEATLSPLKMSYDLNAYEVINNGHTIQVNYQSENTLALNGHDYKLIQFHFHSPSENQINGKSYPLEAHLVHRDKNGNLAVVAVMFEAGKTNETLAKTWAVMPKKKAESHLLIADVSAQGLLPDNRDYYRFNGSLTTPPCTEGVLWLVMKQPITASIEQIGYFSHIIHYPNNRPLQRINARAILE
jgi:carbonic anhydrase